MSAPPATLGAVGLVVALVALVGVGAGRTRDVTVPRSARWDGPALVCPGRGVDIEAVERAAAWWRELGHDIRVDCAGPWAIAIDADPILRMLGLTRVTEADGFVVFAEVLVQPGAWDLVIAHELGHALGFRHARQAPSGHLMHPSRPGWDARGLGEGSAPRRHSR